MFNFSNFNFSVFKFTDIFLLPLPVYYCSYPLSFFFFSVTIVFLLQRLILVISPVHLLTLCFFGETFYIFHQFQMYSPKNFIIDFFSFLMVALKCVMILTSLSLWYCHLLFIFFIQFRIVLFLAMTCNFLLKCGYFQYNSARFRISFKPFLVGFP